MFYWKHSYEQQLENHHAELVMLFFIKHDEKRGTVNVFWCTTNKTWQTDYPTMHETFPTLTNWL